VVRKANRSFVDSPPFTFLMDVQRVQMPAKKARGQPPRKRIYRLYPGRWCIRHPVAREAFFGTKLSWRLASEFAIFHSPRENPYTIVSAVYALEAELKQALELGGTVG
jgi:hypothetical protein